MKYSGLFLFGASLLILASACSKHDPVVVDFGGKSAITLSEFRESYDQGKTPERLKSVKMESLEKHLDQQVDSRLKILAAYEMGLDQDSTVLSHVTPNYERRLIDKLWDAEIVNSVIRESDIRNNYAHMDKDVEIRLISFICPQNSPPQEAENVRQRAQGVLNMIHSGQDFAELAKKYSEDKASAMNGGQKGPIVWKVKGDEVREAAFTMRKGRTSGVLRDDMGFHIIRVEKHVPKQRKPYKELRVDIRRQLMGTMRDSLNRTAQRYWNNLAEENQVVVDDENITVLFDKLKDMTDTYRDSILSHMNKFGEETNALVLVAHKNGQMTVGDFRNKVKALPKSTRIPATAPQRLSAGVKQWVMTDILIDVAVKKGLDRDSEVKEARRKNLEATMTNVLMQNHVVGRVIPTDEETRAFYEENKAERYIQPAKVKAQEVMVKDEALANNILEWAKQGQSFGQLVQKYTERPGYKKRNGILDFFSRGRWGKVGHAAFELEVGEISDVITMDNQRGYAIIKLLAKKPAKVIPFEEVQVRAKQDLTRHLSQEKENAWVEEQKKIFRVQVYPSVLERAYLNTNGS